MAFDTTIIKKIWKQASENNEITRLQVLENAKYHIVSFFESRNVKEVFLYGSVLRKGEFNKDSDLDVAILGGNFASYRYDGLLEFDKKIGVKYVDVIEMEECSFTDLIRKYGLKLI